MDQAAMLWSAFLRSGDPELYLLYRQTEQRLTEASERSHYVYQNGSHRPAGGGDQRRG